MTPLVKVPEAPNYWFIRWRLPRMDQFKVLDIAARPTLGDEVTGY